MQTQVTLGTKGTLLSIQMLVLAETETKKLTQDRANFLANLQKLAPFQILRKSSKYQVLDKDSIRVVGQA